MIAASAADSDDASQLDGYEDRLIQWGLDKVTRVREPAPDGRKPKSVGAR